ncbi:hypothetical protein HSX11_26605 [Oxalobacteraceae bacterium]|nr:hypothetical protein [Oxalobacteraceae bacterium]
MYTVKDFLSSPGPAAELARQDGLHATRRLAGGAHREALALLLAALARCGLAFPAGAAAIAAAIAAERVALAQQLDGRGAAALLHLPAPGGGAWELLLELLAGAQTCAYLAQSPLFPLIVLSAVQLCLRHGNGAAAAPIYGAHALLLAGEGEDDAAQAYTELALQLAGRPGAAAWQGPVHSIHGRFLHWRRAPFVASVAFSEQAFAQCIGSGNLVYAHCAAYTVVQLGLELGEPLAAGLQRLRGYRDFARRHGGVAIYQTLRLIEHDLEQLSGAPPTRADDKLSVAGRLELLRQADFGAGQADHHILQQMAALIDGRYQQARLHGALAEAALAHSHCGASVAALDFFQALTLAALHRQAERQQGRALLRALASRLAGLRRWAERNPANFLHRYELAAAELAGIEGRELDAMRLYELAINGAIEQGFILHAALAKELAARFYRARGFARSADAYLRAARCAYLRWGALGKVAQLERSHPQLGPAARPAISAEADALLLAAKLAPPPMPARLLCFARLRQQFELAYACRLICLIAPAGYGKTTLLAQQRDFVQARGAASVWLTLDSGDNDASRFLHGLAGALRGAVPGLGGWLLAQAHDAGAAPQALLHALYAGLVALDDSVALFLDDYHVIEQPAVHEALNWLLAQRLPQLKIYLASRTSPPLALSRLRLADAVHETRERELGLRLDESGQLIQAVSGQALSAAQLRLLHERTEGWPAGLQLASLALRKAADVDRFVREFSGSDRDITAYLGEIVLSQLPPASVCFLLRSALFERFSSAFCAEVLEQPDADGLLDTIKAQNLFLIGLAPCQRWYRFHRLFGGYLRERCLRERPEAARALYRKGSAWFERRGLMSEAIPYALAGCDHARAADLIVRYAYELVHLRDQDAMLLNWIAALPASYVEQRPEIKLPGIYALLISYRYREAEEAIAKLQVRLGRGGGVLASTVPRKLLMMQCIFYALTERIGEAAHLGGDWLARWGDDDPNDAGNVHVVLGYCAHAGHEHGRAARHYLAARLAYQRCERQANGLAWAETLQALLAWERGDVLGAERTLAQVFAARPEQFHPAPRCYGGSLIALVHAQSCYELNRLAEAGRLLDAVFATTKHNGCLDTTLAAYLTKARLLWQGGASGCADDCLAEGMALAERTGLHRLLRTLGAERIHLYLKGGRADAARRLGAELGLAGATAAPDDDIGVAIAVVRLRLADGRGARPLLEALLGQARRQGRHGWQIKLLCLQAAAYAQEGDSAAPRRSLEAALALGAVHGQCRSFADEGGAAGALLREWLAARHPLPDGWPDGYLASLLDACDMAPPAAPDGAASAAPAALSEREMQILKLLDSGLSNRKLAGRLFLAEATVKWHLHNIYTKLQVSNRTGALARARELFQL